MKSKLTYSKAIRIYEEGGKPAENKAAFALMYLRALKGQRPACFWIGFSYDVGMGVAKSPASALYWYRKAARAGSVSAQYNLYLMLRNGEGTKRNLKEGIQWLKRAAKKGDGEAINDLGAHYFDGSGVRKNIDMAISMYKKAARKKVARAHANLGWIYGGDLGFPRDLKKSLQHFEKAAKLGHAGAVKRLLEINRKNRL